MTRLSTVGVMLLCGALVSVPLSGAFAQGDCYKTAQAEGPRQNLAQGENTSSGGGMYGRQYAQAEGNRQLAQGENTSSGGGMYGRQYAQAEGNRQLAQGENTSSGGGMYGRQYAQAEGNRQLAQGENTSSGGGMYGRQYAQAEASPRNPAPGSLPCR